MTNVSYQHPSLFDVEPLPRELLATFTQVRKVKPTALAAVDAPSTLQGQFLQFHETNPMVYEALVQLARQLVERGQRKVGIGQLFEVLRWQVSMSTLDPSSDLKLNNNYRSRYARLIMEQEPDLADAFELRELRAA